ncbi:NUDIX hydrolase domain containing protein [Rhodotorula toruloides]|uniref:NUDIX hydrolase domain containing protein n=1 Tax=Rhodotorula toruloides TaxID=5286 RepID=A0A511KP76_RHOTO|nr:NUDIX hydrolase domain containing protein [Rhodotorula toruloides]
MASPRPVAVAIVICFPSTTQHTTPTSNTPQDAPIPSFLLVSSRKKKHLHVFPKGGVEQGETTDFAAQRESWEEAGLKPNSAVHLAHLLTLHDPSPHILSPSTDRESPSFVASCQYSFELFLLPPPETRAHRSSDDAPSHDEGNADDTANLADSASLSNPATSSVSPISTAPSSASSRGPSGHPLSSASEPIEPASAALTEPYSLAYLSPKWPESTERTRIFLSGWDELEKTVCWGRREDVMRQAVRSAKEWVDDWWMRSGGRIQAVETPNGADEDSRI